MVHLDLFSGIGGFAYAADQVWPGVEHIFCDTDAFCRAVLKKHWPESETYDDIKAITTAIPADLITGGFPCQPFSAAGRRRGTDDDRYLWPEMLRVIHLCQPSWVIAENVRGLLTLKQGVVFEQVCLDLEASGYEVQPFIIPAVAVNAPHRRDRIWFVAHRTGDGRQWRWEATPHEERYEARPVEARQLEGRPQRPHRHAANTNQRPSRSRTISKPNEAQELERRPDNTGSWSRHWLEVATELCRVDDGVPTGMDRARQLKAYGNAIVPQVAIEIMRGIAGTESAVALAA